ncbi:hypothetical protein CCACVL1_03146 [Corchorus capsularis]|uniref:Uncharacterized protein n=1 Tax=Corchorus capsularis TaxID=210143 RepID=A0A1R3K288_COCAP|nr:hypothetical protein CCACVL1_03146 [Corchorus capsularis]
MDCILPCLFLMNHGLILAWTLC